MRQASKLGKSRLFTKQAMSSPLEAVHPQIDSKSHESRDLSFISKLSLAVIAAPLSIRPLVSGVGEGQDP